jgi:hypothetical protein
MKIRVLLVITVLILSMLACTVNIPVQSVKTGDTQTLEVNEPLPPASQSATMRVTIGMGAGKLILGPGTDAELSGTVRYNVAQWKPQFTHTGNEISLVQNAEYNNFLPPSNMINLWDLKLGGFPTDLVVNAGAYEGTLALGGLSLTSVEIADGASKAEVTFDKPNQLKMNHFSYKTGASTVKLIGLANANFSEMSFDGGAGTYTLDFTGKLQQDTHVRINSGVSTMRVVVPDGTACEINLNGALNGVTTTGEWMVDNSTYKLKGEGPVLYINIDMGVGTLDLVHQ